MKYKKFDSLIWLSALYLEKKKKSIGPSLDVQDSYSYIFFLSILLGSFTTSASIILNYIISHIFSRSFGICCFVKNLK